MDNRNITKTAVKSDYIPNVIIITRGRQAASLAALISPIPILLGLALTLPLDKIHTEAAFALMLACIAFPWVLLHWIYPPDKDFVRLTPDGLSFERHGEVPFSSIKAYTLEGCIRLTRHDKPTLTLMGNKKTPGYEDFRMDLGAALGEWREDVTTGQVKQEYFLGTTLAKVMGALIVACCAGLFITIITSNTGMSALPALAIGTFAGIRLLLSSRQE